MLRTTGKITKKKPLGPAITARTPENIKGVRVAANRSPGRSARPRANHKSEFCEEDFEERSPVSST